MKNTSTRPALPTVPGTTGDLVVNQVLHLLNGAVANLTAHEAVEVLESVEYELGRMKAALLAGVRAGIAGRSS